MSDPSRSEYDRPTRFERLLGDRPGKVIVRLVLLSLLVGFLMSVFGVDAQQIVRGTIELFREALRDGAGVFRSLGGYILTGAALVVPIWLLIRLTRKG
ncbi:DUF6460 domain-containing protein [Devosia sp. J2-20]|jgi:uncharacterized oligopeptide transporter (OPT) family protein|uniref:DUF6460 domain-containing protein n=1 Tax=Devosia sp. J2-20 TaxID=3026161 RepID=UPI00249ABB80|nr:DUF6460 domain-containing protein [Devosia sp. J2-20]WDR00838.1 DUF6460 domain-containing protein [Devosia sp. J2-20]